MAASPSGSFQQRACHVCDACAVAQCKLTSLQSMPDTHYAHGSFSMPKACLLSSTTSTGSHYVPAWLLDSLKLRHGLPPAVCRSESSRGSQPSLAAAATCSGRSHGVASSSSTINGGSHSRLRGPAPSAAVGRSTSTVSPEVHQRNTPALECLECPDRVD